MAMEDQEPSHHEKRTGISRRAKVACRHCNSRRVKCDVSQNQPCRNCKTRGATCEVIESRRGKYPRSRANRQSSAAAGNDDAEPYVPALPRRRSAVDPPAINSNNSQSYHALADSPHTGIDSGEERPQIEEGSEMLFARMAETSPEQQLSESYRDSGRTFYLGEAFSLAFVVKTVCSPSGDDATETRVHYPIPGSVDDSARNVFYQKDLIPEELALLQAKGVYELPPEHVSKKLLLTFFESFYPAYQVFDRKEIATLYEQSKLSLLVHQTINFIASTVCEEELLREAGFENRHKARTTFYLRAKALYDSDQEKDKVKLTAVLFLFGFWWQGPEDQKDTWHWLGAAISLAQTLGMHRTTRQSGLRPTHRSLWKRIWWSIYVRDRHAAAALGRPPRIQDDDCDVEMLDILDFDAEDADQTYLVGAPQKYHALYMIEMSKLAILLGKVLRTEYSASRRSNDKDRETISQELTDWQQQTPLELACTNLDNTLRAPFWAQMLNASFYNTQILLHRPRCISIDSPAAAHRDAISRAAADATTRIAEDLLSSGTLRHGQLHLVPALFAALSVHSIVIRRKDPIRSQLAENRSRQCMLALSELSRSWPVGGWILQLFVNLLKRLTGHDFGFNITPNSVTSRHINSRQALPTATQNAQSNTESTMSDAVDGEPFNGRGQAPTIENQQFFGGLAQDFDHWQYGQDLNSLDFLFQDALFPVFGGNDYFMEPNGHG